MSGDCLFCRIQRGEIPSEKVYEDEDIYGFRDINPGAPVHVLIIPRQHRSSLNEVEPGDRALLGGMFLAARAIAQQEGLEEGGYRCVVNTGAGAGQTVFHLHMHLMGGRALSWPPG